MQVRPTRPRSAAGITLRHVVVAVAVVGVIGWPTLTASAADPWTVTSVASGDVTATALVDQLVGSNAGVTVVPNSVHFTGDPRGLASFTGGSPVGIDTGVALGSGALGVDDPAQDCVDSALIGPNTSGSTTCDFGVAGDADLSALITPPCVDEDPDPEIDTCAGVDPNGNTADASVLQFDVIPDNSTLQFTYVFGSEEYNEFVGSSFNDVFGFFIDGANCATIPGTDGTPVSINNVNDGLAVDDVPASHPEFYNDNSSADPAPYDTQLDGFTEVLPCQADVVAGDPVHLKLAISDVGDSSLDSAVLLGAGSLVSTQHTNLYVTGPDGPVQYSDALSASANLFTDDESGVDNEPVTFTLGSSTATDNTDANGDASVSLPALAPAGQQDLTAAFLGGDGYAPSDLTTPVTITHEDCVLTYTGDGTGTTGQPVTLSAQFAEPADDTSVGDLSGHTVTFELTDNNDSNNTRLTSAVTNAQGVASTTTTLTEGSWLLEPSFGGDFFYSPCSATAPDITVTAPAETFLELPETAGPLQYSDPGSLSATLYEPAAEDTLAGAPVTFTFDGTDYPATTNADGVATAAISQVLTTPGPYEYTVAFDGDPTHAATDNGSSVDVLNEDCTITYDGATSGAQGSLVTLAATLGEPDTTLGSRSGKTIAFSYTDGETTQTTTAVTGSTGHAQKAVALAEGSWQVTPSFAGDGFYNRCGSDPVTITVGPPVPVNQKLPTALALDTPNGVGFDAEYSDPLEVSAALTGPAALPGQLVTFTLGSASATGTTDAQGIATATMPVTVPSGATTLTATFAPASGYLGSADSVPVDIGPETCVLSYGGATSGRQGDPVELAASMTEVDPNLGDRADKDIVFALTNGDLHKTVAATTDGSGFASASKKLGPGTWRVQPTFAGDGYYSGCAGNRAAVVVQPLLTPTDAEITAVQDVVQYSDHVVVNIALTSLDTAAVARGALAPAAADLSDAGRRAAVGSGAGIGGADVHVSLGAASTTVTTDGSGQAEASLKVKDPAGDKTLHVDFPGNSSYAPSHNTSTVHLKREDTDLSYTGDSSGTTDTATSLGAVLAEHDGSVGDLAGHAVTFALHQGADSRTVAASTDGSGHAVASVTLPVGDWSVTPKFAGDDYYLPATGSAASISIEDAAAVADEPGDGPDSGPSAGPSDGPGDGGHDTEVLGEKKTRPTEGGEDGTTTESGEGETGAGEGEEAAGHGEAEHPLNTKQPTFVLSIPDVHQVSLGSSAVLLNGLLALLMILMIAFPAELFNGTLKENYDEVRGWFGPVTRLLHRLEQSAIHGHPIVRTFGSLLFVGLTGVVYAFVEPGLGFNRESVQLIIALTLGLVIITVLANESALLFGRLRYHERGRLRMRPGALLVALGCVLLSRAANFEPGYVYGLVAGFTFSRELPRRQDGKVVLAWTGWLMTLALAGWLLLAPVKDWALGHESSFWAPVAEELTAAVVVESLTILILALVPLSFLEGERIWKWNRAVWVPVYGIALFAFLHVVVHPEFGGRSTELPLFTWLGFFLGFGLFSVAFWAYFRFRHHEHAEA